MENNIPPRMRIERNLDTAKKLEKLHQTLTYQTEKAKGIFADELWQAMESKGLNQVEFAEKAGLAKQFLTRVFKGGNNTIETMVKLAFALDHNLSIHLTPKEVECGWIHCIRAQMQSENYRDLWDETGYRPGKIVKLKTPFECETVAA